MQPKFKKGDTVKTSKRTKCGIVEGTIVEVTRIFSALQGEPDSDFKWGGLDSLERDCEDYQVPWEINGDILKVDMSEYKEGFKYSRVSGYGYSIQVPSLGHRVFLSEGSVRKTA